MNKKEKISPEIIAAVKDIVPSVLSVGFDEAFKAYVENDPDQELTESDLVSEILEAGKYQAEDESGFEDTVMIGLYAVGPILGLI
ncbi:MAG: hypothetical protein U9O78_05180 [Patescibacteria group bacterium]|nr:hypothetical protein [Patescibacteria group bacterium]